MTTLRDIIDSSDRIVFFGGAGVSTESGIPDFRSADGIYSQERGATWFPEELVSASFLRQHPDVFFDYYRKNLVHTEAQPNAAHKALAALEESGKLSAVITQNIDGLHQAAGSKNVLELHGTVHRNYCVSCGKEHRLEVVVEADGVPTCDCGGMVRPDVVLYEEALDSNVLDAAIAELQAADTLIVGGTSLSVYPAAGLIQAFGGSHLVLINRDATPHDGLADLIIREPIGQALAEFV